MNDQYCLYYQAHVRPPDAWFVVGILKSYEHMAFDRTLDKDLSIFEFFVPPLMNELFLNIIGVLQLRGMVTSLTCMPNRLETHPH